MTRKYDNTNRGILFPNDRKETDNQPDHKGSLNVEGKEYWISGWDKDTRNGDAISLSVKPKDTPQEGAQKAGDAARHAGGNKPQQQSRQQEFPDDDIPF